MIKYHQYILSSCESFYSVEFTLDGILHPFQNVIDLLNKWNVSLLYNSLLLDTTLVNINTIDAKRRKKSYFKRLFKTIGRNVHGVSPQTSKEFCYAKKHFCKLSTIFFKLKKNQTKRVFNFCNVIDTVW